MSDPILTTKIYVPPPRERLVHRRRLIDQLNESRRQKLTLLSAPAGFGKSTLLSDWAAGSERPIAWISLDESDSDPRRFLAYLGSALQTVDPNLGASLIGLLRSPTSPPTEWLLSDLINDVARYQRGLTLVLDDYHLVDSKPVDAALTFLLDHVPPHMHLVVSTREDPQVPLARYRSLGRLAELRESDLRFTPAEAAEFLHQAMGLDLSAEDVAVLESRTEGWIVGLQLAGLSMQGLPDTAAFIESFAGTHRFVLDYLLEEVLYRQPETIQDFLLGTSILERLCGPLCDEMLPEAAAPGQDTLESLDRANLFIFPLDHERRWYRYHHLFAELLQDRLARTQPDRLTSLHRRASDWYTRNGGPGEAVRHALAIRDWSRAADVIERFSGEWPMHGGVGTTLGWLESFPDRIRLDRPELGLTYAWNLFMDNQLDRAEGFLGRLAPLVQSEPKHLGEVFAIRVMIASHRQDMSAVVALAEEALSVVSSEAASPRSRILLSVGVAHCDMGGDLEAARSAFREAFELGQTVSPASSVGNAPLPLTALAYLADIEFLEGRLREASRRYDQARELATRWEGRSSIAFSLVQQGRAALLYEWDDLEGAALALEESIGIGESWRNARLLVPSLGLSATVAHSLGHIGEAHAALAQAEELARGALNSPLIQTSLAIHQLAVGSAERDWQILDRWQEFYEADAVSGSPRIGGALAVALTQAWIFRYRHGREETALRNAASLLEPALARSERGGLQLHTTRLHILESLVTFQQGEADVALRSLQTALDMASPENYVRSFVDLGEPMASLLQLGLESQTLSVPATRYGRRLLSRLRPDPSTKPSLSQAGFFVQSLSQREMDVLRLIAEGLSNAEIGERLFLALSTVKGHTRIIFDKLQVHRRTEAVARARELGLL
ncbi:MAG TPA: LuxR C-terminal-related transcriptional regulator [Acidimicrobiia bacterium]|nr:LuxR C-terminal-related transcriptional regulator [Acidimicrobiia bacterium]